MGLILGIFVLFRFFHKVRTYVMGDGNFVQHNVVFGFSVRDGSCIALGNFSAVAPKHTVGRLYTHSHYVYI